MASSKSAIAAALRASTTADEVSVPPPPTPPESVGEAMAATAATEPPPATPQHNPETGLRAVAAIARFYARALAPTTLLVLWMFIMYAGLAYLVPHVLCEGTVSALPTAGFKTCAKPTRAAYPSLPPHAKAFLTAFWAVMTAWLVVYEGLIGGVMFGRGFTRAHVATVAACAIALAAAVSAAPALGKGLDDSSYMIAPTPVGLVATLIVGHALTRHTGDPLDLLRWLAMMAATAVANLIYMIYIPEIVTRRSLGKPWHLLAARMGAHPFIWAAITELFMYTGRYVGRTKPLMHSTMFVWPAMYSAIFGRFLLLQLDTAGSVSALNVILALVGIAGRLGGRSVSLPMKLQYGGRAAEAYEAGADARQLRVTRWIVNIMAEHAGIVCSAAIYTFGAVSPDGMAPYPARAVWMTALWQALTVLAADGAGLAIDWAFHGADPRPHWPLKDMGGSLGRYLAVMAVLVTVGGARICMELVMLFCPTTQPAGEGVGSVMLSYCNKPSLFDKM